MNASSDIIFFIKLQESLRLTAYPDGDGKYSIGYGVQTYEDGKAVKLGDSVTPARAEQLINFHVGKAAAVVNKYIKVPLNQSQFDALVSFVYNVGEPQFSTSTLLRVINNNPLDLAEIETQFKRWIYTTVNGQKVVSNGLVKRRQEEAYLYGQGAFLKSNDTGILIVLIIALILFFRWK